jgi:hypothetical protein
MGNNSFQHIVIFNVYQLLLEIVLVRVKLFLGIRFETLCIFFDNSTNNFPRFINSTDVRQN